MTISAGELFKQDEFWAFIFVFALALLNWPLLSLAAGEGRAFGFPSVLVYITVIWVLIIILGFLFERWYKE